MAMTEQVKMSEYQQRQSISFLQEVIIKAKKERGNNEPDMFEMQIYYHLSELNAIPKSYIPDWPTSLMK